MSIYKYNILNPVIDKHKPHYIEKGNWFEFPTTKRYRYYVEVSKLNDRGITEYYLLLSEELFDENCRICDYSIYHGTKIHPRGELKDYIVQESKERGNLYCTYKGTEEAEFVFDTGEIKVIPYDIYHIV